MNKTIKAIELLNMMKNGEIDEIEIIEEQSKIDIQNISEDEAKCNGTISIKSRNGQELKIEADNENIIKKLIIAVKELDKRIKKLEE